MTDAWGYVRLSQDGDASIEDQKEAIREYARDRGLSLATTRNDGDNTSGFDEDREEYQLLREKIEAAEIDAVITRDRARLSRDFDERIRLVLLFRQTGVEWHVVEAGGHLELEETENAMLEAVHAMTDYKSKKAEIERSKQATEKRMERGDDHGRPPFGLKYDDEKRNWIPDRGGENGGDFGTAIEVIRLRDAGYSWREITEETGEPRHTVRRIVERKERYLREVAEA